MKNQYTLEWSQEQNCFHIQPLESLLAQNQASFMRNETISYITLMVGEEGACRRMAESWRERLGQREKAKAA